MENNNQALKPEELNPDDNGQVIENEENESKENEEVEEEQTDFSLEESSQDEDEESEESSDEESVEDRLKKAEEERDNYKKALLKAKKSNKAKVETPQEDVETIATNVVEKTMQKNNEDKAINMFLSENPEYRKSSNWALLRDNYSPKNGNNSSESILKDLKRADILVQVDKGELTPEKVESYRQVRATAQVTDLNATSLSGSPKSYSVPKFENDELKIMEKFNISEEGMKNFKEKEADGQLSYDN